MCPAWPRLREKKESPFQIYSKDQTPENFINAYNAYNAQMKDTADYGAGAMLAWLNYYELDRNLEVLKANEANLTNMNKFQYANILLELGRYDEAIPLYSQINEKNPEVVVPVAAQRHGAVEEGPARGGREVARDGDRDAERRTTTRTSCWPRSTMT